MVDTLQIKEFISQLSLFVGLKDNQINQIASHFSVVQIAPGERIVTEGNLANNFNIIYEGSVVLTRKFGKDEKELDVMSTGDYFGHEEIIYGHRYTTSIIVEELTTLFQINSARFYQLLQDYTRIRQNLIKLIVSQSAEKQAQYEWVGDEETILLTGKMHNAYLVISLAGSFLLGLIALVILVIVSNPSMSNIVWILGAIFSSLLATFGVGLGIWHWLDWENDYFAITDWRVVWTEQVIGLYNSRREAPLNTLRSVDKRTTFIGRLFDYGNVIVTTYTGKIVIRNIGQPVFIETLIKEHWRRVVQRSQRLENQALEAAIVQRLNPDLVSEETAQILHDREQAVPIQETHPTEPWQRLLGNFFSMRYDDGSTITYRKYWLVLLEKTWKPMVLILILVSGLVIYIQYSSTRRMLSPTLEIVCNTGLIALIVLGLWWLYQYWDWKNDIYQVTDRFIYDIERKPLGTELKKSAPLDNILSLEHERVGLFGYIFNYGNVIINVGETNFVFLGVFDPARVQQDIFNKMYSLRQMKEMAQTKRERERIVDALAIYHQATLGQREPPQQNGASTTNEADEQASTQENRLE